MGTPEFAVPSLKALLDNDFIVVGVVTAPDTLGGRGMKKLIESPVKKFATSHGLKVLQPTNLKSKKFIGILKKLEPDIIIVIAFRMLPEVVWALPKHGTYNLHASLLPAYRGAAPINHAIMHGEKETGLTIFRIQKEIDTGEIAFQTKMPILEDETAGDLHDRMMAEGPELVIKTVNAIKSGNLSLYRQNDAHASSAPKIFTENCEINWNWDCTQIYNFTRGLSPYPGAWTIIDGKKVKILKAEKILNEVNQNPGAIVTDGKTFLDIYSGNGKIRIVELQMAGKSKMHVRSFLNGYKITSSKTG